MDLSDQSNLSDLFLERMRETPHAPAYRQFEGSLWCDWSWGDIAQEVGRWQTALAKEGFKPGDRVALCLHNRVEWMLFDQAAIGLGLVTVPLYFDDRPDNMAWCLNDADARALILENAAQWEALKDKVAAVERVIILGPATSDARVRRLQEWLPARAAEPLRSPAGANDLATIVYTSGTTGRPKGVMLSHRNILSNVLASMHLIPVRVTDRFLSFLPLSHMFERTCGYYSAIWAGAQTVYARNISTLAEDMRAQKPTILIAVPRIFERVWSRMQEKMAPGSFKRRLFEKAVDIGWRRFKREPLSFAEKLLWPLLDVLVAQKVRNGLGGRVRLVIVGGAALAPDLARIFIGLGLTILHGYGSTETSPVLTANREGDNDPLTVGRAVEHVELRCGEDNELLARGPNIMLGYWNNREATEAAIDREGWFRTGDIAQIQDGRVKITGRVKDIIVLSNGEKIPPGDAEHAILRDPAFEQVMLIGEGRPKLGLLCVSKTTGLKDLCARANAQLRDFPGYSRIRHIARLPEAWTVENGLLTPTQKVKRREIQQHFAKEIEAMYAESSYCGRDA